VSELRSAAVHRLPLRRRGASPQPTRTPHPDRTVSHSLTDFQTQLAGGRVEVLAVRLPGRLEQHPASAGRALRDRLQLRLG